MKRALVVVDVQNEYFSGLLPITHPQGHLTNILRVMDAAAAHDIPLVVVQLDGMISNDKFCCTRWGVLKLSWWRRPNRLRR